MEYEYGFLSQEDRSLIFEWNILLAEVPKESLFTFCMKKEQRICEGLVFE